MGLWHCCSYCTIEKSAQDTRVKIPVAITATFGIVAIYLHGRHKMVPKPGKRNQRTILSWSWFHLAKGQLLWPVLLTCGIRISSGTRYWFPVYLYRESPCDHEYEPFFSTANWSQSLHLGILKNPLSNQYVLSISFPCPSLFLCIPNILSLQDASCSSSKSFCPVDTSWSQYRFVERRCFKVFVSSLP